MTYTYISLVSGMVLSFFLKGKQKSKVFIFLLISLIILLSLRTNPDEYIRYLYNECRTIQQVFFNFPLSESLYRFIGFLSYRTPNPRFSIYLITYGLTFLCLNYSLKLFRLDFEYRIIPIVFYLAHYFLSLSYIAIRPGLANSVAFLSISVLINKKNYKLALILAISGFFIHLQVIPFLFIGFTYFFLKDFTFFRSKLFLYFVMPSIFIIGLNLKYTVQNSLSNFLSNANFDQKYLIYMGTERHGYQIDIFSNAILLSFVLQIVLAFIFIYFLKIKESNFRFALIMSLLYPTMIGIFSNIALYAFRFASTFLLFNLPLIGLISKKMQNSFHFQKKTRISFLLIMAIIATLLFYNIFYLEKLKSFSYTLELSPNYLKS